MSAERKRRSSPLLKLALVGLVVAYAAGYRCAYIGETPSSKRPWTPLITGVIASNETGYSEKDRDWLSSIAGR